MTSSNQYLGSLLASFVMDQQAIKKASIEQLYNLSQDIIIKNVYRSYHRSLIDGQQRRNDILVPT